MPKASKVRKSQPSGCLMIGFFGIFALVGGVAFYFLTVKPIANLVAARGWEERVCEILSSEVDASHSDDGTTYRVEIHYRYQVEWQTYEGDRYNFSIGHSSGYESKRRAVDAHPPGSETTCYVDPDDPTRSVINRNPGGYLWWGLFPLPFLAVGVGGLLFVLKGAGKRKPSGERTGGARSLRPSQRSAPRESRSDAARSHGAQIRQAAKQWAASLDDARPRHGPLDLEPAVSPLIKILGTLFIALFWNGIVSVFLFTGVFPGFRSGNVEWITTLFMVPFVLVGLGLIGFFFYTVLASFNPRPRLTLEDGHLTPGSRTGLSWQFAGSAGRLQKLTIELEGRESARYRRGTSTSTDHHVFYSDELVSETRYHSIHRGETELRVPERTMPSFKSSNNGIEWRLKVRGEIPFWPDVIEDFTITVDPSRAPS
jgi:hypothetical protein